MLFLRVLELMLMAYMAFLAITQVIGPLLRGRPAFPLFRTRGAERRLAEMREAGDVDTIHEEADRLRSQHLIEVGGRGQPRFGHDEIRGAVVRVGNHQPDGVAQGKRRPAGFFSPNGTTSLASFGVVGNDWLTRRSGQRPNARSRRGGNHAQRYQP